MAKKKDTKQLVVQQIIVKSPQRRVYDVGDWRTALRAADYGRTRQLYDLFDDIIIDGVLFDAIDKRIDAVLNSDLIFTDRTGKENEEISRLIDTTAWATLMREIMNQRFFGRAALEMSFADGFRVEPIKPKYIDLRNRQILLDDTGSAGIPYDGDSHLLVLGKDDDFGLLLKAAPYAIWKRGGFGDYAQWIELFGMPQRIGKYNTYDTESRKLLEEAMEKAGSAPYVIIPKEAEVEMRESNTGSGDSFNDFRKACNEEILITILGQTLTTVQGDKGARSLGEVHMEVEDNKHQTDLRFVQRTLNEMVVPMLIARGFNLEGGQFVFPKAAETLSVNEIVQLTNVIEIPASYIYERFAIPMPADGETIAGRRSAQTGEEPDEVDNEDADDNTDDPVKNADGRSFLRRMWDFFVQAPQDGAMTGTTPTQLSSATSLDRRVMRRVARGNKGFDVELWRFISKDLVKAVRSAEKGIQNTDTAFAYNVTDSAMQTAMEINLFRFSAAKTLAEVQELNRIFRTSKNYRDFEERASKVCSKFNAEYQRTEFDTAFNAAQSASNYMRLMRLSKVAPYWEYVTASDNHVRESHKWLDGVILPFDDAYWQKIFPPNGWNCRCTVIGRTRNQVGKVDFKHMHEKVERYFETKDWEMSLNSGWGVNRALRGEVFLENQFYIKNFAGKENKTLGELYHDDWDLPSFEKRLEQATQEMPVYEGSATDWYRTHQVFRDYMGREVELPEKVFEIHTKEGTHYATERVPLLDCIEEILSNPDEIWLNDFKEDFKNLNMIRFYRNDAVNVVCEVTKDLKYEIKTWFVIHGKSKSPYKSKDPRYKYRRGLLIKK